jgi:hypothetical protein
MTSARDSSGQAGVELLAVLPALLAVAVVGVWTTLIGYSWIEARSAARVAERGVEAGRPASAGLEALPPALRRGARARPLDDGHEVSVRPPGLGAHTRVRARSR